MSTRGFVSGRPPRQNRRLCDELGVIQAALLMAGCDSSSDAGYIEGYVWRLRGTLDVGDTFRPSTAISRVARKWAAPNLGALRRWWKRDQRLSPTDRRLVTLSPSVPASGESLTP